MSVPNSISVASSVAKSRLSNPDPWLSLVKISPADGSAPIHLVRNTVDILFADGTHFSSSGAPVPDNYTAFAWEFSELNETSDGSLPKWAAKVSNIGGAMQALMQQYDGLVGGHIDVYIVQASRLKREPDLQLSFDIVGSSSDYQWVTLQLGAESWFRIQFLRWFYSADGCHWRYKSGECGYTGDLPTCSFLLNGSNGCREHGNQLRFGAYPGVDSNGLRMVSR